MTNIDFKNQQPAKIVANRCYWDRVINLAVLQPKKNQGKI